MTKLKLKALNAYNEFIANEYGSEPTTEENFKGIIGVLFSSFDAEGYENEIEIQVSYDLDKKEYVVEVQTYETQTFTEKQPLKWFITDMEDNDFQGLYEYFVGKARDKFRLD